MHVPQADLRVVAAGQEVTLAERRPAQTVPLRLVTLETKVGGASALRGGLGGMPGVVKHVHVGGDGLGGEHEGVLGAVPRAVHLAVVVDQVRHLYLAGASTEAAHLAALVGLSRVHVDVLQGELRRGRENRAGLDRQRWFEKNRSRVRGGFVGTRRDLEVGAPGEGAAKARTRGRVRARARGEIGATSRARSARRT